MPSMPIAVKRLAHRIQAVRLDDGDDQFHGVLLLAVDVIAGFAMGGEIQALGLMFAVHPQAHQPGRPAW